MPTPDSIMIQSLPFREEQKKNSQVTFNRSLIAHLLPPNPRPKTKEQNNKIKRYRTEMKVKARELGSMRTDKSERGGAN